MAVPILVGALAAVGAGTSASADSAPPDPTDPATPRTVTADALPTAQLDGVGLAQVIIGHTVYVAGKFSTARPAGAAPGEDTVPRRNLLAYDLVTGKLDRNFAPRLNDEALALAVSPDKSRLYVGGYFTKVDGKRAKRIVALNPRTGKRVKAFKVSVNRPVRAIVTRRGAVWFGGDFDKVDGHARVHLARVKAKNGAVFGWSPRASNGAVTAMAMAPDGRSVMVGGRFTKFNGYRDPGYGLARVDSVAGRSMALPANRVVRNAGRKAGIMSLISDGQRVWGSTFAINQKGGNFEGSFAVNWSDGEISWLEDCHGDTYSVYPAADVVYAVGHPHNCTNIGGFPDTDPKSYQYAVAFSKAVTQTVAAEPAGTGYASRAGYPAPSLLTWFPTFDIGSTTAARQGPWHITGHGKYLAVAGEFMHVNREPQQGLVRFVTSDLAPNQQKPRPSAFLPELTSPSTGTVDVSWLAPYDRDNQYLTYQVYRVGEGVVWTSTPRPSTFWDRPTLTYTDSGLPPGSYRYEVRAIDPFGNVTLSDRATITIS